MINKLLLSVAVAVALTWSLTSGYSQDAAVAPANYAVDSSHSAVLFRIGHMGISNFYGRFNEVTGSISVNGADHAPTAVSLEIPVDSLDSNNEKRDQHLKSPDFFNALEFRAITFKSKAIQSTADGKFTVTGELTLHGTTQEISTTVELIGAGNDPRGGKRVGYETVFTLKRSDFGMTNLLDAVGDEVKLIASFEGLQQ